MESHFFKTAVLNFCRQRYKMYSFLLALEGTTFKKVTIETGNGLVCTFKKVLKRYRAIVKKPLRQKAEVFSAENERK